MCASRMAFAAETGPYCGMALPPPRWSWRRCGRRLHQMVGHQVLHPIHQTVAHHVAVISICRLGAIFGPDQRFQCAEGKGMQQRAHGSRRLFENGADLFQRVAPLSSSAAFMLKNTASRPRPESPPAPLRVRQGFAAIEMHAEDIHAAMRQFERRRFTKSAARAQYQCPWLFTHIVIDVTVISLRSSSPSGCGSRPPGGMSWGNRSPHSIRTTASRSNSSSRPSVATSRASSRR